MKRRTFVKQLALAASVAAIGFGSTSLYAQGKTVKIGVLHSLSGTMAISETVLKDTVLMAVDEINAAGGIDGIKVEAVIEDHQGVPRVGVDALQRLRSRHDIQAVLLSYSTIEIGRAHV